MATTLAEIRQAVVRNLGGDTTQEHLNANNVDLTTIVNEANHAIEGEADWPWLEVAETITTVADIQLYTPTAGWYRTITLSMRDYGPLKFVSQATADQLWPTADTGIPFFYSIKAGQLDLRPIPNGAYSFDHLYYQTEPLLIDDGDEPLLPERFRGRLIDQATVLAAIRLQRWKAMDIFATRDSMWSKRMLDDRRATVATASVSVRPGTWGGSL